MFALLAQVREEKLILAEFKMDPIDYRAIRDDLDTLERLGMSLWKCGACESIFMVAKSATDAVCVFCPHCRDDAPVQLAKRTQVHFQPVKK